MKKSERYYIAMCAVVDDESISAEDKLDIVATLMEDKSIAEYLERQEAEKAEEKGE
jgi:hypothetical protein